MFAYGKKEESHKRQVFSMNANVYCFILQVINKYAHMQYNIPDMENKESSDEQMSQLSDGKPTVTGNLIQMVSQLLQVI